MLDERCRIAVGNLQSHSKKHGEDEEYCHVGVLEKFEGIQSESLRKSLLLAAISLAWTVWKSEAVHEHYQTEDTRHIELVESLLE